MKKPKDKRYERMLDKFIEEERVKFRIGSGDDGFYEQQVIDYINKQRTFWIDYAKFIVREVLKLKKVK